MCVSDDRHHEWTVDLDPYADNEIDDVEIALQKQTATGWSVVSSAVRSVDTHSDDVKITDSGIDFGGSGFFAGAPSGSGSMHWHLDDGKVEPHLTGSLHLDNSSGVCARMNLRYLSSSGAFLTSRAGGVVCAADNAHHSWSVDLEPYESNKVAKVTVQTQTQGSNGSWNTAGSKTVSIAE